MKIAYLGFDTLLPALHTVLQLGATVLKIYTCPCDNYTEFNVETVALAAREGIPCTGQRITGADLRALQAAGCELLLCTGYYYRVPLTQAFPMVNIHPAPLPEARGAWPMPVLLLSGAKQGGVTLHKIAQEFDTGDILLQQRFALADGDTLADYMRNVYELLPGMVRTLLANPAACLQAARPQGSAKARPTPTAEMWTVNCTMRVAEANRILRVFYGYECLYRAGDKTWELIEARAGSCRRTPADLPLADGWITARRCRRLA